MHIKIEHWLTRRNVETCQVRDEKEAEKKLEEMGLQHFANGFWVGQNLNAWVF